MSHYVKPGFHWKLPLMEVFCQSVKFLFSLFSPSVIADVDDTDADADIDVNADIASADVN